jgi:SHS2 domain-containing protein
MSRSAHRSALGNSKKTLETGRRSPSIWRCHLTGFPYGPSLSSVPYRVLDHTADYMVEVRGRDLAEVAADAAVAMFALLTDLKSVRAVERVPVRVCAETDEQLLVTWLTELLFLYETELWLFSRFDIRAAGNGKLEGEAWGERLDAARHQIDREVKAVTYHRLDLERSEEGFRTTIVFDL